jgi:predicted DNA-binding transcriptional regulator YafY
MSADRLLATLLLLQRRGRVTAAEVADELEVSLATARRDLQALSGAGVPVYPQPGRGGGWQLVGGARTDLTGFTAAEATALMLLVGPSTSRSAPAPLASAVRKLVRALPEPFRDQAEAAAGAVVADPTRWGAAAGPRPEAVDVLQDAVVRRRRVWLEYASRGRPSARRLVDPYGLVEKGDVWYLVAGTEHGERTFRVDRITSRTVTEEPAERPPGFDLSRHWDRVADEVEQRRSRVSATVLVPARLLAVLQGLFGHHCEVLDTLDDGRLRVRVAAHMTLSIAETLAGFGAAVEVVDPDGVRDELARLGAELVERYPGHDEGPRSEERGPSSERS